MAESPEAASVSTDARGPIAAGVLVGLVVLVLGFGAGLGAVWERAPGSSGGARQGNDLGGAVQASPPPGDVTATVAPAVETAAPAGSTTQGPTPTPASRRSPVPSTPSTPTSHPPTSTSLPPAVEPAAPQPVCSAGLVSASVEPFVEHLEAAHLETSASQQVADALSVDSYALAHTILVGQMADPVVTAVAGEGC